jgi:hydrogenase/urease accessory protein HupE
VTRRALVLVVVVLGVPQSVRAHPFAPALLQLEEGPGDATSVSWKQPTVRVQGSRLRPVLPPACDGVGDPVVRQEGTGLRATWQIRCRDGLAGKAVGVEGIASSQADVLLRITLRDGRKLRQVLTASAPSFEIRAGSGHAGVFRDYARLGVQHILTGWDHLLFILGLVLLVGWGGPLLWTATLALASLGVVHVPQPPIEAAIALSIYVLAVELARRDAGIRTFTQRAPWLVAASFGLLHGLGFAGALSEVGLPSAEIPLALLSFNVGIELGQLAFIAGVLLVGAALRRLPIAWPRLATAAPAYATGGLAIYWFCERVAGLW